MRVALERHHVALLDRDAERVVVRAGVVLDPQLEGLLRRRPGDVEEELPRVGVGLGLDLRSLRRRRRHRQPLRRDDLEAQRRAQVVPVDVVERVQVEAEIHLAGTQAQHALGRALFEANYKEEALTYLEKAAELEPTTRTLLDLAVAYSGAARLDDAEAAYGRLLKQNPGFPIALHNLGSLAYRRGNHERAIAHFGHALQADPAYLLARLHLGEALEAAGRPREAYRAYEQVLGMEPRNPQEAKGYIDALYGLAALDLANGAHERAGQLLTELIRIAPNHNKAYYAYGQLLLYMGHPEDAQKAFDKHVQILAAEEPKGPVAMGD